MKQVLLMLVCDCCRSLYEFTRAASADAIAWDVHGGTIINMALDDGWAGTEDGNFHYCPTCFLLFENMFIMINEPIDTTLSN